MHGTLDDRQGDLARGGTRREALLGGALAVTAGIAFALAPRRHVTALGGSTLEKIVPERFAGWEYEARSNFILPPSDQLQDKIYSQLVTRQYRRGNEAVMMLIAYSARQDGAIQVHRPEVCYPASGLPIRMQQPFALPLPGMASPLPAQRLIASNESRDEELIYWVRIGKHFPQSWIGSHLSVMDENLHGIVPDGVLVRLSRIAPEPDPSVLAGFAEALVAAANPTLRRVLLG